MPNTDKQLVIIGGGEFAHIAYEYFTHDSDYQVCAFCVDKEFKTAETLHELPFIEFEQLKNKYPPENYHVHVAVTYTKLNRVREQLYNRVKTLGYTCANYISSQCFKWHNVSLGDNCFIFENNTIQPFVELGNNIVLWSGNHIGHRSVIEDHCYISSHVVISGYCRIGKYSFLGVNSTLADNVSIGNDCLIGAGAVILKSTDAGGIYQGNPGERKKVSSYRYYKIETS